MKAAINKRNQVSLLQVAKAAINQAPPLRTISLPGPNVLLENVEIVKTERIMKMMILLNNETCFPETGAAFRPVCEMHMNM